MTARLGQTNIKFSMENGKIGMGAITRKFREEFEALTAEEIAAAFIVPCMIPAG
jgi:hypothetical protein